MGDVDAILAEVRSLATRGEHHLIVARYGQLDDATSGELWNAADLLYEVGRAFGMLGNEDKVERYLLRCAELSPKRAAVYHCGIGWYYQRKKKWTKALRWYDRALESFPTYHLCLFRRGYCLEKLHRPREAVEALRAGSRRVASGRTRAAATRPWCPGPGAVPSVPFTARPGRIRRGRGEPRRLWATRRRVGPAHHPARAPARQPRRAAHAARRPAGALAASSSRPSGSTRTRATSGNASAACTSCGARSTAAGTAYRRAASLPRGAFAFLSLGRLYTEVTHDHRAAATALAEALRQAQGAEPLVRLELARLQLALDRPHAALAETEQALACRREGSFPEALSPRCGPGGADRGACEGRRLPAEARQARAQRRVAPAPHRASRSAGWRRDRDHPRRASTTGLRGARQGRRAGAPGAPA